jgi:hypothetical protein
MIRGGYPKLPLGAQYHVPAVFRTGALSAFDLDDVDATWISCWRARSWIVAALPDIP